MIMKPEDFKLLDAFNNLTIKERQYILSLVNTLKEKDIENIFGTTVETMEAIQKFQLNTKQ